MRTAKAMGLRGLPSKTWQVNAGWVAAANIAADLAAWTRLLGHADDPDLHDADPDTLRYRIWHIPARLARHARQKNPRHQPRLALGRGIPDLLASALRPARTRLTSTNHPTTREESQPGAVGAGAHPGTPGLRHATAPASQTDTTTETGQQHNR